MWPLTNHACVSARWAHCVCMCMCVCVYFSYRQYFEWKETFVNVSTSSYRCKNAYINVLDLEEKKNFQMHRTQMDKPYNIHNTIHTCTHHTCTYRWKCGWIASWRRCNPQSVMRWLKLWSAMRRSLETNGSLSPQHRCRNHYYLCVLMNPCSSCK